LGFNEFVSGDWYVRTKVQVCPVHDTTVALPVTGVVAEPPLEKSKIVDF